MSHLHNSSFSFILRVEIAIKFLYDITTSFRDFTISCPLLVLLRSISQFKKKEKETGATGLIVKWKSVSASIVLNTKTTYSLKEFQRQQFCREIFSE